MTAEMNISGEGFFTIDRVKGDEVIESLEFKNLILDSGLSRFMGGVGAATSNWRYARVGTGTSTPNVAQSTLDAQVSSREATSAQTGINTEFNNVWFTYTYLWAVGGATGNLSEVGVGASTSGSDLFSRARILDTNGDPTTITVLADEQLRVTYTFRLYRPSGDLFTGAVGGYDVIFRPASMNSTSYWGFTGSVINPNSINSFGVKPTASIIVYSGDIGSNTGAPTGTSLIVITSNYDFSSNYISPGVVDCTIEIRSDTGNLSGGIRSMGWRAGPGAFQCQFEPKVPKTADQKFATTFRYIFTRV